MEELINYDGLIYSIISKYPTRYDREDLYQVSMIGLMEAYRHYDACYETKFSTFAYYYIVGEVNKYIRESNSIKVSKSLIELKSKIIKAREVMAQRLGREPTTLELSLFLEVDENMISDALLSTEEVDSLENQFDIGSYDEESTRADILDLRWEIEKLPKEERDLILARYYQDMTQSEASNILGMSQVQVSRNEGKILQKLKQKLVA